MIEYRQMTIDDYEAAYELWIKCGNGLNDKDDSRRSGVFVIDRNIRKILRTVNKIIISIERGAAYVKTG